MSRILKQIALLFVATGVCAETGLVAHWRFDAATNTVADLSGHGHHAQLTNVRTAVENGKTVAVLDGTQKILVPSHPDLNLTRGFCIVAKVKLTGALERLMIVHKDKQYQLRVDQAEEEGRLSFFPYVGGQWESRVSALQPRLGAWYHLAATWDGSKAMLWVNGLPFSSGRVGEPPQASDAPLTILSSASGGGMQGAVEYVKIYRRLLLPREIAAEAFGLSETAARVASPAFDFSAGAGLDGWVAQEGAAIGLRDGKMEVSSQSPNAFIIHNRLGADITRKDYVSLRMACNKGGKASLIFVTDKGAGDMIFQAVGDGKPHTYVFAPWTVAGWGGQLLGLGLIPSDTAGNTVRIEYLEAGEAPRAAPDIRIERVYTGSTLPRAGRPDRICVRLRNEGGKATGLAAALALPRGLVLNGDASQRVPDLDYQEDAVLSWEATASQPVAGEVRVTVSGAGMEAPASSAQMLEFQAKPEVPVAAYVPVPVPAKTRYTLWTHYCALWKHGTHYGWKKIEPWPERKPLLGWYNEGTPEVADWHIKFMVEHGISGVIYCWYRASVNEPVKQNLGHALEDGLLKARYLSLIKFGIMWENGCAEGVASTEDLMRNVLPYWIDNYFSNPSYIRVNGIPVLYIWVPARLRAQLGGSEKVKEALELMRAECRRRGLGGLIIVGAQSQDKGAVETLAKEGWDATSAYGNGWRVPEKVAVEGNYTCAPVEGFIGQQAELWAKKEEWNLLPDVRVAMMGWDPRPWHNKGFFWSENTAAKFRSLCQSAKAAVDASARTGLGTNTVLFCCWNEFGEGHFIEPTRGSGFAYLDAIRDTFCEGSGGHADVVPEDVGMPVPDSWYRTAGEAAPAGKELTAWSGQTLAQWTGSAGFGDMAFRDGLLRGTTDTRDPVLTSSALNVRAGRYTRLAVEMRLDKPGGGAQLFWSTASTTANEAASVAVPTVSDGQWHTYIFEVGKNPYWGGCVTSLRFDPVSAEGVAVEIRSIRLE